MLKKGKVQPIVKEDWKKVLDIVTRQREAIRFYREKKFKKAVDIWPEFPEAWINLIFGTYGKDPSRQEDMIQSLPDSLKKTWRIQTAVAQWLAQMDRLDDAQKLWGASFVLRPNASALFIQAQLLVRLGRIQEAMPLFVQAQGWDPRLWTECQDWMSKAACSIPTWDERAKIQVRDAMVAQAEKEGRVNVSLDYKGEHTNGNGNGQAQPDGQREEAKAG